ncbi:MAG: helix-turn-helix transcriptional regulator [Oscillospiraceae bacterium]|nr:helix-turn-helix transcriptional regulator [Oscillospiraceae bacterium]
MNTRIRTLREDRDLTQTQVAEALGISQRKYSYLETGVQQWTDELLVRLAGFYQTSVDYLLERTDERKPYPVRRK